MECSSLKPPERVSSSWRIAIVHSEFHGEIVSKMADAAERMLKEAGLSTWNIRRFAVPGSFEIPLVGASLLEKKEVDAVIGLGIIVEGETHHARLLAENVARGIMDTELKYLAPFAFEVLYVKDISQAEERAGGKCNKGKEAAVAVLRSLAQLEGIR